MLIWFKSSRAIWERMVGGPWAELNLLLVAVQLVCVLLQSVTVE